MTDDKHPSTALTVHKKANLAKKPGNKVVARKAAPAPAKFKPSDMVKGLPPAAVIYALGAGAMFAFAMGLFFHRHWMEGGLTLLPAMLLGASAAHIVKYSQPRKPKNQGMTERRN